MPFENPSLSDRDPSIADIDQPTAVTQSTYPDHVLRGLDATDLMEIMERDGDAVPCNVIQECGRRGAEMEALLAPLFEGPPELLESDGLWWLRLHALNILGVLASSTAAEVLTRAMSWLEEFEEEDLLDWCAGYWPAWFRNKPDSAIADLQKILVDQSRSIGTRLDALECVVAAAVRQGPQPLDSQLDAVAELIGDTSEPADMRFVAGAILLNFPRARHRTLLEQLADEQTQQGNQYFSIAQVIAAYEEMCDSPPWVRFNDPLKFYRPEEFQARQHQLEDEELDDLFGALDDDAVFGDDMPYVRDTPKIGRNDPCYCGSGKKYKKCCLRGDSP